MSAIKVIISDVSNEDNPDLIFPYFEDMGIVIYFHIDSKCDSAFAVWNVP